MRVEGAALQMGFGGEQFQQHRLAEQLAQIEMGADAQGGPLETEAAVIDGFDADPALPNDTPEGE